MPAFVDRGSASAHLAAIHASCVFHAAIVAPVESSVYNQLLASLRAGKGAPVSVRSVERCAPCVVHLEEGGALVAWEEEGAPRVLVDGDIFFAAHAACGTLADVAVGGVGAAADVCKLMQHGLSYSGAMACALRERERRWQTREN
jgi:hypothetical protein